MLELERLLGIRYFDGCHFHISNSGQSFEERKNEVQGPWLSHTGAPFIALFCFHSPSLSGRLAHQPHPGQVAKAWVAAGTQVQTMAGVDEFDLGVFITRRREENQRKPASFDILAADFYETELVTVKIE